MVRQPASLAAVGRQHFPRGKHGSPLRASQRTDCHQFRTNPSGSAGQHGGLPGMDRNSHAGYILSARGVPHDFGSYSTRLCRNLS